MRIPLRNFFKGLWLTPAADEIPPGSLRRARGVHAIKTQSIKSRNGSALLYAVDAHSIVRFNDIWFFGVGTAIYKAAGSIQTGLSGDRLSFVSMPPTAGIRDYLFASGGDTLYKISPAGSVTDWGIALPSAGVTATPGSSKTTTIDDMEDNGGGDDVVARWADGDVAGEEETGVGAIVQEGSSSLKLVAPRNALSSFAHDYYAYQDPDAELDLTAFSDATEASDEDYISFWVYLDNPANVDSVQLDISIGNSSFSTEVYTALFVPSDIQDRITGIGSDERYRVTDGEIWSVFSTGGSTDYITAIAGRPTSPTFNQPISMADRRVESATIAAVRSKKKEILEGKQKIAQSYLPMEAGTWKRIFVGKEQFSYRGSDNFTWADARAFRFQVKTNLGGAANVYIDDFKLLGGYGLQGAYQYLVTFRNSTTGTRSNSNEIPTEVLNVLRQVVELTDIPVSPDSQVDQREIWRTIGDGVVFFRAARIEDNTTTTFTDDVADLPFMDTKSGASVLETEALVGDNIKPYAYFDDCAYHNASAFWTTRSEVGERGRLYYSPIGRLEAMQGFIEITNDDDPCQRVIEYNGVVYVWTQEGIYQVSGTNPYTSKRVFGCPGTTKPHTVVLTAYGVAYEAHDGVRLFDGTQAELVGSEAMESLFRGEAVENLTAFSGVVAASTGDEYFISDTSQTIAINLRDMAWRDLGVGCNALHYAKDSSQLAATVSSVVLDFEKENETDDNGTAIAFAVQTPFERLDDEKDILVERVHVDANTNNVAITVTLLLDNETIGLGTFTHPSRDRWTIPVERYGRLAAIRLTASLSVRIEVFGFDIDIRQITKPER